MSTPSLHQSLLIMSLSALILVAACGGGSDSSSVDPDFPIGKKTTEPVQAKPSPDAPLEVYLLADGVDALYRHVAMREGLIKGGVEVLSFECRIPGKPDQEPSSPQTNSKILFPSSGLSMYYVAEIRTQDFPIAQKMGFLSPLSQRAIQSAVASCPTMD